MNPNEPSLQATPLSPELLDTPVRGRNLRAGGLRNQFGPGPTLFVFLRHFG